MSSTALVIVRSFAPAPPFHFRSRHPSDQLPPAFPAAVAASSPITVSAFTPTLPSSSTPLPRNASAAAFGRIHCLRRSFISE